MKRQPTKILALTAITALFFACNDKKSNDSEAEDEHPGINLAFMDTSVNPKEDFYSYVNGSWMKKTEIPSDRSSWGSFMELRKTTDDNVLALLDHAIKNDDFEAGSDQAKAVYLYKSQLDSTAREEAGFDPIKPIMAKIEEAKTLKDLQELTVKYAVEIGNPFFSIYASGKYNDSSINGAFLNPGRLGLPDRDYYTNTSDDAEKVRGQYKDYIARMFEYWGDSAEKAKEKADHILALETKLAEPRMTKEESRDVTKRNNPRTPKQIKEMTAAIDWQKILDSFPVEGEIDELTVTQLNYMKELQNILTKTPLDELKLLVSWTTLNGAVGSLSPELEKANWEFYSKTLNGVPEQRPAEERALARVNGTVGEALGKIYVAKYFPPEAKEFAETMVEDIKLTYIDRIQNLEWMTEDTKKKAIEKVKAMTVKIGYPDEWKDYSEMEITSDNGFYDNLLAASRWRLKDNLSKINQPVDTNEWFMNPQTVNAYFNPSQNEIVFPAAIMQPPFFDYQADAAVNFGGIGAVIGHEISHAFDDSGSRYDAQGNVNNWWTEEDLEKFKKRTNQLIDFYSKVEVEDGLHLNGEYTVGENGADLGGVTAAYHGMQRYYQDHEKPGEIDGFTQEQRFFLSWATVWRNKTRTEALRTQIKNDPHSPGMYRAYLPLQNIDEFYEAFNITEGDPMYVAPENRVRIW